MSNSSFSKSPTSSSSCISKSRPSSPSSSIALFTSSATLITISALCIAIITFSSVTISLNSYSFNRFNLLSNTFLYFSTVWRAWFACESTASKSFNTYLEFPLNNVIIPLLWEILITSAPVCFAVRSAVLCLVPVSVVKISDDGISWAFA